MRTATTVADVAECVLRSLRVDVLLSTDRAVVVCSVSASAKRGHRRRFGKNRAASGDAVSRSEIAGFALRPHEIWARPYARGFL